MVLQVNQALRCVRIESDKCMKESIPLISVVIVTYNPNWEKLKKTIISVVLQEMVNVEIIISDDGSKLNYHKRIIKLFSDLNVREYTLLSNPENEGTVKNVYRGLKVARGKYVKLISPGDYLYEELTLYRFVKYMEQKSIKVCFGAPIYYNDDNGLKIINHKSVPQALFLYRGARKETMIRKNYLVLYDMPLGASFCVEKDILFKYLSLMIGKIKIGDDFVFNIMVFHRVKIYYFDHPVIWYEYGHGVSTSKNMEYSSILKNDLDNMFKIIGKSKAKSLFDKKLQYYIKLYYKTSNGIVKRMIRYCMFPDIVFWRFVRWLVNERTKTDPDYEFLDRIDNYNI